MPQHPQNGFSLVELMVAMVISLLVAIAVFGLFNTISRQSNQTTAAQEMWQQGRIALHMMEKELSGTGFGLDPVDCSQDFPSMAVNYDGNNLATAITISAVRTGIGLASVPLGNMGTDGKIILAAPAASTYAGGNPYPVFLWSQSGRQCSPGSYDPGSGAVSYAASQSPGLAAVAYVATVQSGTVTYSVGNSPSCGGSALLRRTPDNPVPQPVACGVVAMDAQCTYAGETAPQSCQGPQATINNTLQPLQTVAIALLVADTRSDRQYHGPGRFTLPSGATISIDPQQRYTLMQTVVPLRNFFVVPQ